MKTADTLVLQADHYEVVSGSTHDGSAKYRYWRDTEGSVRVVTRVIRGHHKGDCADRGLILDWREAAYNPHV